MARLSARDIARRNPGLDTHTLNFAVNATIDRVIFLRMCEDRGIEAYGRLQELRTGNNTYQRLLDLYREADSRYNSGLFHFSDEVGRTETADRVTSLSASTIRHSRTSFAASTTRKARMNSAFCPPTYWATYTSSFWARSSGLRQRTKPRSNTSRRSRRRVASTTRRATSSSTSSRTRSVPS